MRRICPILVFVLVMLYAPKIRSQESKKINVLELVRQSAKQLYISATDAEEMMISSSHFDAPSGILYVYVQQRFRQIKVHNSMITLAYRGDKLLYSSGRFVDNIAAKAGQLNAVVNAPQAATKAAGQLGLRPGNITTLEDRFSGEKKMILSGAGIAKRNIEAEMYWISTDNGVSVKLAWNVNVDVLNSDDWWNVFINAVDGSYITRYNWTVHEQFDKKGSERKTGYQLADVPKQEKSDADRPMSPPNVTSATYKVIPFPKESPSHGAPADVNNPWELAGSGNNATTHGWHFDGNNNYDITRGNNVFAYLDVSATNIPGSGSNWPDTSTTTAPALTFVNTPNFNTTPKATANKKFALDNLFYWNNLMHDVFYQYGFTEVAGNFQTDNLGRGGLGNDHVNAQAQDGAGMDNANFSVPNDGFNGRMRMYLFNGTSFLSVNAPSSIAGNYLALEGNLSTANLLKNVGPVTGQVLWYDDASGNQHEACGIPGAPVNNIAGKIAMINRGNCNFSDKIKNAQTAGAIAVIMVNNVAGDPLVMGGTDNTVTIPAIMITQSDGAILAAQIANNLNVTISEGGRDGDLDNSIVCHEYGHGISIRLTGGPANSGCLVNAEQGGEGWSDYFGLMMTTNWNTATVNDGALLRPVGTYAMSQNVNGAGIRRVPYTTNMSVNTLTYANMSVSTEEHDIGEIWCSALWDMTWGIIQQTNSITTNLYNANGTGGNVIAMKLVMMGLKLQPCGPGFLDARNAILAADSILYNGAHKCVIWNAFARRGMGASAVQGLSINASDQVAAFDVPAGLGLSTQDPIVVTAGSSFTINTTASCQCQPISGYVLRDTIPSGFTVVNSTPAGSLNGNVYSFTPTNWSAREVKNFSITLQATGTGCNIDSVINDNRDTRTIGGFTSSVTGTGGGWTNSSIRANTGLNSWLSNEPATISTSSLTSANTAATAGQNLSILSFSHFYNTERTYDGGIVEYSTDGTNWFDASPLFIKNGYNAEMDTSTILSRRKAFTGSSNGFIRSTLNLGSLSSTPVAFRFRMTSDEGTSGEGWYIDDIVRANGCGGIIKTGVYTNSGTLVDTFMVPVFVRSQPSSITVNNQPGNQSVCSGQNAVFTVSASSATALSYQWQLSTNGGVSFANITNETNATLTVNSVTAVLSNNRYRCVITDAGSTLNTNAAVLTVNTIPAVTTQPADKNVCVSVNVSFTIAASGTPSYQWQVSTDGGANYSNLPGAISTTLSFAAALSQNANKYRCVITNNCGSVTTNPATLNVSDVRITSSPADQSKCQDAIANFSIATIGTGLTYQWQLSTDNGTSFANITGANTTSYNITGVAAGMNGNRFRCVVTAPCGVLTSTAATLTVDNTSIANFSQIPSRICESDTVINLSALPAGGTWSGNGVSGNRFSPAIAGIGQHMITYRVTAGPGCVSTFSVNANVEDCIDRNLTFANKGILLYPNPNDGQFFIKLNSLLYDHFAINVYNSAGQVVSQKQYNNLQYGTISTINLKHLTSGVYHIKVYTTSNGVQDQKTFTILIRH